MGPSLHVHKSIIYCWYWSSGYKTGRLLTQPKLDSKLQHEHELIMEYGRYFRSMSKLEVYTRADENKHVACFALGVVRRCRPEVSASDRQPQSGH